MASKPLATPSLVVRVLVFKRTKTTQKEHSYHFGLTSALRAAAGVRGAWIEKNGERATLLVPSRSAAIHARGYR
jgi:hypothetical protein